MNAHDDRERALTIPEMSLVLLVGTSGSGKSTFAAQHFGRYETLSSDVFRGLVSNDENDQAATPAAFAALKHVAAQRLRDGLLTVVDATNVQPEARRDFVRLARDHDVLPVAIVLDVPESVCVARNAARTDRDFGADVVRRQQGQLRRGLKGLNKEGFRRVHVLRGEDAIAAATIVRQPLLNDRRDEHGPFDVIGDVHGCRSELEALLGRLGWTLLRDEAGRPVDAVHPDGRRALFLGDLVDRGPDSPGALRLVMGMVRNGHALAVPGNHEDKLVRALDGRKVQTSHGLAETLAQLAAESEDFRAEVREFCRGLVGHLVLDDGALVVAHAGMLEQYQGRASGRVRSFALYGDTTGESDEYGLPVRLPWADSYRGSAMVLYGHTPTVDAEWINGTMCLDTGCVFGGKLSALRYPERELVQVDAERVHYEAAKPLEPLRGPTESGPTTSATDGRPGAAPSPRRVPGVLPIEDVTGRQIVETRHHGRVGIRAEHAAGALEVMSRFAIDPRWLPYLPPTMSPVATSALPDHLEHPAEAFTYFRDQGVQSVRMEEKHMGSRATVLLARDPSRFDAPVGWNGVAYTRTGRSFFDAATTTTFAGRLSEAFERAGLWAELDSDWVLLDGEVLPWAVKAEGMIRDWYAEVGAAAAGAFPTAVAALESARDAGVDVADLLDRTRRRAAAADAYTASYRRYATPSTGIDEVRFAPFQVLAAEGRTFADRPHGWHLDVSERLAAAAPDVVRATRSALVDVTDDASRAAATDWWQAITEAGGEGAVVKPEANLVRGPKGLVQPGVKVRGREYLRIIYGPEYSEAENLARLRDRDLRHKRSMALREYALGLESLERFVAGEPLWRVHQSVFGVLAMESEAVDPRL
ncbi:polynucleotide 3'-phosphatase /polynucleotide 5'-hydroxyl-kinase /polynucleotide 2',3'-cyclic phosphate phosphodiesterase [Curtobacterium sp. PhB42]|uniref:polynucleotide kinase-phosphatase n=1 Tax=unclassified Curtobacterium TaxID=257496 RepID=UPI00104B9D97|nr:MULTISPECIES: polynucleotide kinase-phosphatase [unclassified Curtobacterium]TCU87414.1 polynucleotide 3'-phosphatase /polynucleotide 5'-hydroxyl-kinase /polynucleotide 2',3'-cyclic phosphate phosphodiesterase [Curtobacterium sp. PhB191]TDW49383.1 polynucleotide 3'-phosphatase /polynucleotide 5'-hydroxyl-kinase /polynucleotide 2',3'-cyclic phosphate phosphodiesterase [Curtobacterium sp. PhB42]TDW56580.1 polynucleotide 3'-phosphatase /polynucleotide 5'-hydroxyl-kinase /polynucleotide 2',3'-cyc